MNVSIEFPDVVKFNLRDIEHSVNTSEIPSVSFQRALAYGLQRMVNDRMKTKSDDAEDARSAEGVELLEKLLAGESFSTRRVGSGRTSDPVKKEVKRLADAEITANIAALLEHHKVTAQEFNKTYRAKYVAARIEKHAERLDKAARANLAKVSSAADGVDLLDM